MENLTDKICCNFNLGHPFTQNNNQKYSRINSYQFEKFVQFVAKRSRHNFLTPIPHFLHNVQYNRDMGNQCILGASVSEDTGENGLKKAYGKFKEEALDLNPEYQPKSVNTDGWKATVCFRLSTFTEVLMQPN